MSHLPRRPRPALLRRASAIACRLIATPAVRTAILGVSPSLLARLRYRIGWGTWPDLKRPRTLDEKLMWLMLYWQHPLKTLCADKYAVRAWLEGQGLGEFLPKLHGVWSSASEIDFAALPDRFVLKCTHGCGFNIVCRSKAELDVSAARRSLDRWLATDYADRDGEIHYRGIHRRIIAEELLVDPLRDPPLDYKIWCFNGVAEYTIICSARTGTGAADYDVFDRAWRRRAYMLPLHDFPRPDSHATMTRAAERIAGSFPFVRVDFYDIAGRVLIGELTFTPSGCLDTWLTSAAAPEEIGSLLALPEPLPG